jgi:hypothetical protein
MEKVIMTRSFINIYTAQVCAEKGLSDEDILREVNISNPSGTSKGWTSVVREVTDVFKENCMPKQCADYPDRMHYLITC